MYLLMLLATFMSAIYGYNLSARADYDRDIVMKKAAAIIYRFTFQHATNVKLTSNILNGRYLDPIGLPWVLPGDYFYANDKSSKVKNNETIHTFLRQGGNDKLIYLRRKDLSNSLNGGAADDYLPIGRAYYDGRDMATRIMCLDRPMNEAGAKDCTSDTTGDGIVLKSCCQSHTVYRYIVSYKKIDPRWVNRISGDVNVDFTNALFKKEYYDNIGVIHWKDGAWRFRGKIQFYPVFANDLEAWEEAHKDDGMRYPPERKKRTHWTLPPIFTKDFFISRWEGDSGNICQNGCLFKIQSF